MKLIFRDIYLRKIQPFIDTDLIKVLIGQRRVGKSYILRALQECFIKDGILQEQIIHINMEQYNFHHIKNYEDLLLYIEKNKTKDKKCYLFIDEIQDIKEFEKALRSLQSEGGYDIYISGSNAHMLSGELATYLTGRYKEISIYALSYREFLMFHILEDTDESLLLYIKYGGLPYLKNVVLDDEVVYGYIKNVYDSILLKDIVGRYGIRNIDFLQRLIEYIVENVGSLFTANNITKYLKSQQVNINTTMVLNYLQYLDDVFLVKRVKRIDIVGKKVFEVLEKVYLSDLGMRHTILGGYQHKDIGKVLEQLVYHEAVVSGYTVYVGKLYTKEVDFVLKKGDKKIYIQVAYLLTDEATRKREFGNLLSIKDNHRKIMISMDPMISGEEKGIEHLHIRYFLMNGLSF